jgi:hypothetical protein
VFAEYFPLAGRRGAGTLIAEVEGWAEFPFFLFNKTRKRNLDHGLRTCTA